MKTIISIFFTSVFVVLLSYLLPGVHVTGWVTAVLVAVVLGLLNIFVKPLLILLTLPVTIFTLGLFLLVINALIIELCDYFVPGFRVNGFWWALLFSLILSFCQSLVAGIPENKVS